MKNQNQETVEQMMRRTPGGFITRAQLPTTQTIEAELGLSLTGTCPSCDLDVDLLDDEGTGQIVRAFIRSDKASAIDGLTVGCPSCKADLKIDLVI